MIAAPPMWITSRNPGGFAKMRGYPIKTRSNPLSYDPASAAQLWAVSAELTGVRYTALDPVPVAGGAL